MKHLDDLKSQLRKKLPPMRPDFKDGLRVKLYQNAEQRFNMSSKWPSILLFITMFMKRYSMTAIGLTVALVVVISSILPPSISPLSPEEVLAQVEKHYSQDREENLIYHEKVKTIYYVDGVQEHAELTEVYFDEDRHLSLIDENLEEAIDFKAYLVIDGSDGFIRSYQSDLPDELVLDESLVKKQVDLSKNMVQCVRNFETERDVTKVYLTTSSDDFSIYQTDRLFTFKDSSVPDDFEAFMLPENEFSESPEAVLENLIERDDYVYDFVEISGEKFHHFSVDGFLEGDSAMFSFLIDPETHRLSSYNVILDESNLKIESQILESSYIDDDSVFDPKKYDMGLYEITPYETTVGVMDLNEDGCYDSVGNELDVFILNSFPPEAVEQWESKIEMMEKEQRLLGVLGASTSSTGFESVTHGVITQGFSSHHQGVDIASDNPDLRGIYAPLDGVVKEVVTEGYNDGKGFYVRLEHPYGDSILETFYYHLSGSDLVVGQLVESGQLIAQMGNTGRSTGPHLHLEIHLDGQPINPFILFEDDLNEIEAVEVDPLAQQPIQSSEVSDSNLDHELLDDVFGKTFHHLRWGHGFQPGHYALDFYAKEGQHGKVFAPADGIVTSVAEGWNGGYGNTVMMSHVINGIEIETLYAHLSEIYVQEGQKLEVGGVVGIMGRSGRPNPDVNVAQLHFETRVEGVKVDPLEFFNQ